MTHAQVLPEIKVISALDQAGVPLELIEAIRRSHPSFWLYAKPWDETDHYHFTFGLLLGKPVTLMRLKAETPPRGLFLAKGKSREHLTRELIVAEGRVVGVYCEVPPELNEQELARWAKHLVVGCWAGTLLEPWHDQLLS